MARKTQRLDFTDFFSNGHDLLYHGSYDREVKVLSKSVTRLAEHIAKIARAFGTKDVSAFETGQHEG